MNTKKYVSIVVGLATISSLAFAMTASAAMGPGMQGQHRMGMMRVGRLPGVFGKVSAVNGNMITISGQEGFNKTAVTYTVDATNAKITKDNQAGSITSIVVGDVIAVQGTVNGTAVLATTIRDGMAQSMITGNGQPVVAGSVTVINGNTITITNKSNITYTIDVSGATFSVRGITNATVANVVVGDSLIVQGTVNGTSIVAATVIDQKPPVGESRQGNVKPFGGFMGGFMGSVTGFFKHIFGF